MAISSKPQTRRLSPPPGPAFSAQPPTIVQDADNRPERAKAYEEKTAGLLNFLMRACAANEGSVADAAAFIEHGPGIASKAGDLAHKDVRVRKAIDFLSQGTDNPYVALGLSVVPLLMQVIRNHESEATRPIQVRIPLTKKTFTPRVRIRLRNGLLRSMTSAPRSLIQKVFGDPAIKAALISTGVDVALPEYQTVSSNGNDST